jgi:hypothetical protein
MAAVQLRSVRFRTAATLGGRAFAHIGTPAHFFAAVYLSLGPRVEVATIVNRLGFSAPGKAQGGELAGAGALRQRRLRVCAVALPSPSAAT